MWLKDMRPVIPECSCYVNWVCNFCVVYVEILKAWLNSTSEFFLFFSRILRGFVSFFLVCCLLDGASGYRGLSVGY